MPEPVKPRFVWMSHMEMASTAQPMVVRLGPTQDSKKPVISARSGFTPMTPILSMLPHWATRLDPIRNVACIDLRTAVKTGNWSCTKVIKPVPSIFQWIQTTPEFCLPRSGRHIVISGIFQVAGQTVHFSARLTVVTPGPR